MDEFVLRMAFRPPYDWKHMQGFLAARAIPGVERVDAREYARTFVCGAGSAIALVRPNDDEHSLELRVRGAAPSALNVISSTAHRMFDLGANPRSIVQAFKGDALLAPLVRERPGLRIPGVWDPFECAVRAVIGQQISVAAGRTMVTRLVARLGQPVGDGADGLTHLFPTAEDIVSGNLDGLGFTSARKRTLQTLAQSVAGGLKLTGPSDEVIAGLTALPGIGAWTAHYVALRALGDRDAFPVADLVLRRVASGNATVLTARALEERAELWRPWRAYATVHLWRAANEARAIR